MALVLTVSVAQQDSCATLVITDTTGLYSSGNPTGWSTTSSGGGNLVVDDSSITAALITLTSPDENVDPVEINLKDSATWKAVTPYTTGKPFDDTVSPTNLYYAITAALAGIPFVDGIWTVEISITGNVGGSPVTTVYEGVVGLFCNIQCCIDTLIKAIPQHYNCDKCNSKYISDVMTAKGLLEALKLSAAEAQVTHFNNIQETLSSICELLGGDCSHC